LSSTGNSLTVSFHGVRGSTPSPGSATARYGGNTSCVEVRANSQILILDAGTGIRDFGPKLTAEFGSQSIEAILLISHTHWDHIQGLPFFGPAYSTENMIRVLAPKGGGETVKRALRNQMDAIHFPVPFEKLTGLSAVEELGSNDVALGTLRLRVAALNHPGGCAGFRIEANGRSIAYLPDHEPSENDWELVEFVQKVDLLILDTQYSETEYPGHRGWGHGCLANSVALAVNAGVRELALFHHDPSHDDDQIDRMVERGRQLAGTNALIVNAARENQTIALQHASAPYPPPSSRVATIAR
jgi:phosphoribosyl 1,2-cyclic phosphodiesterase